MSEHIALSVQFLQYIDRGQSDTTSAGKASTDARTVLDYIDGPMLGLGKEFEPSAAAANQRLHDTSEASKEIHKILVKFLMTKWSDLSMAQRNRAKKFGFKEPRRTSTPRQRQLAAH